MSEVRCERCETLLREYRETNGRLIDAGMRLEEVAKSWEYDVFERLWQQAHELHLECARLRAAFRLHLETHGS